MSASARLGLWLTGLGTLFAFLQWAETSPLLRRTIPAVSEIPFGFIVTVLIFATLALGIRELHRLSGRLAQLEKAPMQHGLTEAAVLESIGRNVTQPFLRKLDALESRMTADLGPRLGAIEQRLEAFPRLRVIVRGSPWAQVRFGDRQIDVESSALDYYEEKIEDFHREKIHGKIARHPMKTRWTRIDFMREVDEKARLRFDLDEFIGQGDRLLERAKGAVFIATHSPPTPAGTVDLASAVSGVSQMVQSIRTETETWEQQVYRFLGAETIGDAEEFYSGWPEKEGPAEDLRSRLETRIDRIRAIKGRI